MARGYSDAAAAAQNLGFEGKRLRRSSLDAPLPFPSHAFALAFFHCSRCFARAPLRIYAVRIELCIAPRVLMQADSTLLLLPPSSMPLSPSLSPNLFHFAAAAAAAASSTAGAPTGAGVRLCASLSR